MAPPRTMDHEEAKRLLRDHPEWPYATYAVLLTEDSRRKGLIGPADWIKPDTVRRIVSQYRSQWEAEGVQIPARGVVHTDLLPPTGAVAPSERMATPLRYLRELSKERRGEHPVTDNERVIRGQAIRWEARLRANREIVDVTKLGVVEIRPARVSELNESGELIELAAWALPGYQPRHRMNGRGRG